MKTKTLNCIVCEKEFTPTSRHGKSKAKRKTCSPKCAKVYQRIYNYVQKVIIRNLRREKK